MLQFFVNLNKKPYVFWLSYTQQDCLVCKWLFTAVCKDRHLQLNPRPDSWVNALGTWEIQTIS